MKQTQGKRMQYKLLTIIMLFIFILNGCGNKKYPSNQPHQTPINLNIQNTYVYIKSSPYAKVLMECIDPNISESESCTLNTLPLIAQDTQKVSKRDIMNRLLVSDAWMAKRFSQFLDEFEGKHLNNLFGAVTAIMIHRDIIPSFYTPVTGAIYLNPDYLWLTPQEADTIGTKEDSRTSYGSTLKFRTGSIYSKNSQDLPGSVSGKTRQFDDLIMPFAGLLYHELAHANDFVSPARMSTLDNEQSIYNTLTKEESTHISSLLYQQSPLLSNTLSNLGKVLFHGQKASSRQRRLTAEDIQTAFDEDRASDIYGYSNQYEDLATLFSNAMMKVNYDVDNNVIFYDKKTKVLSEIINPVAKAAVAQRALFVANRLNPIQGGWERTFEESLGHVSYNSRGKHPTKPAILFQRPRF